MTTALAKLSTSQYLALNPSGSVVTLEKLMTANTDGSFSVGDLAHVTVPAGGSMTWTVPHPDGEKDTRELTGVILFAQPNKAYYKLKTNEADEYSADASKAPDCKSSDGITGQASPVGVLRGLPSGVVECVTCPLNQWGSANGGTGKGKACQDKRQLFMLLPDRLLPVVVTASPTSLKGLRSYMNSLLQIGQPIYTVETTLTLKRVEAGSNKYSVIVPAKAADLSAEDAIQMEALAEPFKTLIARQPVDTDE